MTKEELEQEIINLAEPYIFVPQSKKISVKLALDVIKKLLEDREDLAKGTLEKQVLDIAYDYSDRAGRIIPICISTALEDLKRRLENEVSLSTENYKLRIENKKLLQQIDDLVEQQEM